MREVVIITDSTCDLPKEIIKNNNFVVVPLYVNFENESYRDGIDIDGSKLYEIVESTKKLPKTSGASPGDFYKLFKTYIDENKDVLFVGIGSNLSVTVKSAIIAGTEFDDERVVVVDSDNLSTGIGLLLLKAAKYRDMGMSNVQIKAKIDEIKPFVKCQFVVESLDYLHKGGRCSSTARFFGKMLSIKPLIVVREGKLKVGKKVFGSTKKALKVMIDLFEKDFEANNVDTDCIFVTNTDAEKSRQYISSIIDNENTRSRIKNIFYSEAGSVIASHCGKGTIGILYITKNKNSADDIVLEKEEI